MRLKEGRIDQAYQASANQAAVSGQSIPKTSFREYPILVGFFYWWLKEAPTKIFQTAKSVIFYYYKFFSIPILFKTLFDPWKKDEIDITNMALDDIIRVKFMNLISRLVGAVVRSMTIAVGVLLIIGITVLSGAFLLGFLIFPILIIFLLINALGRFNGGL
jgi:hypothetical protein